MTLLRRLDQYAAAVPRSATGGLHRAVGSAAANARRSLDEISRVVDERRALHQHLDTASDPGDLSLISREECLELLRTRTLGRLAYVPRVGVPEIVPVNYTVAAGRVLVRSGPGPKLQAAERGDLVALEVDDIDESHHTGWSVVVLGRARKLAASELAQAGGPAPWATGPRRHVIAVELKRVTGRRLL